MSRKQKVTIIVALITGICTIISAVIGNYIGKENTVNEVINQATNTINVDIGNIDDLIVAYGKMSSEISDLKDENLVLVKENETLKNENDALNGNTDQFLSLIEENSILLEENNLLKNQIAELQNELQLVNNGISNQENEITNNPEIIINNTGKKVSIFDLDTFQGEAHWFKNTSFPFSEEDDWLIDMYGNEFHTGYIAFHGDERQQVDAVYNLDNKYSQCNIKIAWPRGGKNLIDAGAYIKFYADGELLDISPEIKCGDEPIEFSINLSGVKKFSFERIATGKGNAWMTVTIIYCYFDLIENNI